MSTEDIIDPIQEAVFEVPEPKQIDEDYVWKILETRFDKDNKALIDYQLESFEEFIERGIQKIIDEESQITVTPEKGRKYTVEFGQVFIPPACTINEKRKSVPILPYEVRMKDMTYESPVQVDITETLADNQGNVIEENINRRVTITHIPIMLGSSRCRLRDLTKQQKLEQGECAKDPGGYFIINGKERVLIAQVRNAHNQIIVAPPRKAQVATKYQLSAEIRSMSDETGHSVLVQAMIGVDNRTVVFFFPNIGYVPVGVIFKAMGYTSQEDILHLIGINDEKAKEILTFILHDSYFVQTEEEAIQHISLSIPASAAKDNKMAYTTEVVKTKLLPHLGITASTREKALFLGHVVNKLISTYIGLRKKDDIDHYNNKRFEPSGVLFTELFRNLFKQYLKTLSTQLSRRAKVMDHTDRLTRITTNIRHSMSTGNWGPQKNTYYRTGVSQVLNRLSYASSLSHLRRVAIPLGKESKTTKPRQIHTSSFGFVCPADCFAPETPILMWDGSIKRADEIKIGDKLIDELGNSTEVYKTTSGVAQMYEIRPKGGEPHVVTYNHILTLKIKNHNKITSKRGKFEVMWFDKVKLSYMYKTFTTHDEALLFSNTIDDDIIDIRLQKYLDLPQSIQNSMRCFYSDGVNWPKRDVLLDPYILGSWLGDGMSSEWAKINNETINNTQTDSSFNKSEKPLLKNLLNIYNLVNNKHIPMEYIVNDRETRLKVLAGLIDANGTVRENGREILMQQCSKNKRIIYDALFLAKSLGFKCHVHQRTSYTKTGDNEKTEICYELSITGSRLYEIPTILPVKKLEQFCSDSISRVDENKQVPFTIVKKNVTDFVGWQLRGSGRFLLPDFIVSHNTPEGKCVGIVLNFALLTKITRRIPTHEVKDVLRMSENFIGIDDDIPLDEISDYAKIFLNGSMIGFTEDPEDFVVQIKDYRETDLLNENVSVVYNTQDDEVQILCDEGRLIRPVFPVNNGKLKITRKDGMSWDELVKNHKITYIDPAEAEASYIAMWPKEVTEQHTCCEIHPSMILGICASTIPFPDHSQSPRNTYQSAMIKQAMGIPYTTHGIRADTLSQVMHNPQRPLVQTKPAHFMGFDEMPSGQIAVVAIMLYSGFNQEDSVILNKSAVERGLFCASAFKTYKTDEDVIKNNISYRIMKPATEVQRKGVNYSYLGDEPFDDDELDKQMIIRVGKRNISGIVTEGTKVQKGDAIIGKIVIEKSKGESISRKDCSVIIKAGEEGIVDRVYLTKTQKGQKLVKVVIKNDKIPEIGDKFAARSAQKGTCGMLLPQEDMPFNPITGMSPSMLINSHCIPSRMTINQLQEMTMGKSSCYSGEYGDATPFGENSVDIAPKICEELKKWGFQGNGREVLFNGMTGERIEAEIYMGPTFYQRLKHMVGDKIHARARGNVTMLTRQPLEGRSRDGGLRFGEMERDCIISHGGSRFLTERLYDMSDPSMIPVCKHCGQITNTHTECSSCNDNEIVKVKIPYAAKLLVQDLEAMSVNMTIKTK